MYRPQPLPTTPGYATTLADLREPVKPLKLPGQDGVVVRPGDGLSADEAAVLAVLNNPQLNAERAKLGEARAQAFAAGLLPDPTLDLGVDRVTTQGADLVNGWSAGLVYPLQQLLTHSATEEAAKAQARKTNLELLWAEWQTAQQARLLVGRLQADAEKLIFISTIAPDLQQRYQLAEQALKRGDLSLDAAGTDLAALVDMQDRRFAVERDQADADSTLHALLGLQPDTTITLSQPTLPSAPGPSLVSKARRVLASRRPDLLALKAGYQSQEARVRAAILAQFPALGIGISRAKDTSAVYSTGFSLTLDLPLFSGNRGDIAVQRATRAQLRAAYQARLSQADSDIAHLQGLLQALHVRRQALARQLPQLQHLAAQARKAYLAGDLDAASYLTMTSGYVDKRLTSVDLWQQDFQARVAMQTLLGLPSSQAETQ